MRKIYAVPVLVLLLTACPGKTDPAPTNTPTITSVPTFTPSTAPTRSPRPTFTVPKPSPTVTQAIAVEESSTEYGVTPGAYCDTRGTKGTSKKNNKVYTCKGPGNLRWRR